LARLATALAAAKHALVFAVTSAKLPEVPALERKRAASGRPLVRVVIQDQRE
jgi:hypothetical protein